MKEMAQAIETQELVIELLFQTPEECESIISALLFIADKPMNQKRIMEITGGFHHETMIQDALTAIQARFAAPHSGIELAEIAGGYQFRTKVSTKALGDRMARVQTQRLSRGALETLAIIAYKQPVIKDDIDQIRGVDSAYFFRYLMERKLIIMSGRSDLPGRPLLYTTTPEFLEIFGLMSLQDLPSLDEISAMVPGSETEDPKIVAMRSLINQMNMDHSGALDFDPEKDEEILQQMRSQVASIATSTPTLDALDLAKKEELC